VAGCGLGTAGLDRIVTTAMELQHLIDATDPTLFRNGKNDTIVELRQAVENCIVYMTIHVGIALIIIIINLHADSTG
jgi:hypothetical protein